MSFTTFTTIIILVKVTVNCFFFQFVKENTLTKFSCIYNGVSFQ